MKKKTDNLVAEDSLTTGKAAPVDFEDLKDEWLGNDEIRNLYYDEKGKPHHIIFKTEDLISTPARNLLAHVFGMGHELELGRILHNANKYNFEIHIEYLHPLHPDYSIWSKNYMDLIRIVKPYENLQIVIFHE